MTEILKIGDKHTVTIEPDNLKFNELSLNEYIQKESGYYDHFGASLAMAEKYLQNCELLYEKVYNERFCECKDTGGSDKKSESQAKCDPIVVKLKTHVIQAKYVVNRLKQHLRAWDKNHDNAQSMGHTLRREMDKLSGDIRGNRPTGFLDSPGLDRVIEKTVDHYDSSATEFETDLSLDNLY